MTGRGKLVLTLFILAMAGIGGWRWYGAQQKPASAAQQASAAPASGTPAAGQASSAAKGKELTDTQTSVPKLGPPGVYQEKDNVVEIELSEYAGYAGLIVANGGLEASEQSLFFKKFGFKVKITLSEEESWNALNAGKIAASATTADVLAVYGRQFNAVTPAQIGFSRGADGLVVRKEFRRINALKGKVLATAQFTEADFFIRYLAQEAGLAVHMLENLESRPDPESLNLVFCTDAFAAGDLFLRDLKSGKPVLAGCVTWAPKTSEVAAQSAGQAHVLATTANLLIVADLLVANRGYAEQKPDRVAGLVQGLLEGNAMVAESPAPHLDTIGRAFKWDREKTRAELAKVHFSNLPENLAFFSGAIESAGSFGGIYQAAVLSYGPELLKEPVDSERFVDLKALQALEKSGMFQAQKIVISPIRTSSSGVVEGDPLLSKNIRFLFQPNSSSLVLEANENSKNLEAIKRLLQVSPGSKVLLRGHVDNAKVEEFRRMGGEAMVRKQALEAIALSRNRAAEVKKLVAQKHGVDPARLEIVGRGWEEPLGAESEQNRRVEAQWFTLE